MCQPRGQGMLCCIHLLQPAVWVLFVIWANEFNGAYDNYASQCETPSNVNNAVDNECPTDYYGSQFNRNTQCDCVHINDECEIAYNLTNCVTSTYTCECQLSLPIGITLEIFNYILLADILFFEAIKLLIVWCLCSILSNMKARPNGTHDPSCLECGIQTLGNSFWLQCIMCVGPGRSVVLYMYHRGMLLKSCGCCCIFFWQVMVGGAMIFFYGYVYMVGLTDMADHITLASPDLYYIALIINSLWVLLQFVYCCSPTYTGDDQIKERLKEYNLPWAYDAGSGSTGYAYAQPVPPDITQQIPLQVVQPQPVQPQVIYFQQTLPNGQVVYMQSQPQGMQQPQQVIVVPQPALSVASSTGTGVGGHDYNMIQPSAPVSIASAPPGINPEFEAPPPAYSDAEGGNVGPGPMEGGATNI